MSDLFYELIRLNLWGTLGGIAFLLGLVLAVAAGRKSPLLCALGAVAALAGLGACCVYGWRYGLARWADPQLRNWELLQSLGRVLALAGGVMACGDFRFFKKRKALRYLGAVLFVAGGLCAVVCGLLSNRAFLPEILPKNGKET